MLYVVDMSPQQLPSVMLPSAWSALDLHRLTTRAHIFSSQCRRGHLRNALTQAILNWRSAGRIPAKTTLAGIDAVQTRFLRECGLSDEDALLHFNLAPLEARRDIAMLGFKHRSVLGYGPRHFGHDLVFGPRWWSAVCSSSLSWLDPRD